jgi:hypothetical protein
MKCKLPIPTFHQVMLQRLPLQVSILAEDVFGLHTWDYSYYQVLL